MIPNEYLFFYYFASDTVAALRSGLESRAEFLLRQQAAFYGENGRAPEAALEAWRATRRERDETYFAEVHAAAGVPAHEGWEDMGGYEGEALAVVEAIARGGDHVQILNTANRSSLPFLDAEAVVEVPCVVGPTGVRPLSVGDVPGHARALIESIKVVERLTIDAALTHSRELAVEALALHPLVPSVTVARRILDAYASRRPELAELLRA
jgi:6-phospho-beta-glucosidase